MVDFEILAELIRQQTPHTHIDADPFVMHAYAIDGVDPGMVITPTSVNDMAQAIQLLSHYPLTILPYGGGTAINFGGLPGQIDVILNTTELHTILEHEAPDLTCHVEAGIKLADLQEQLATKGQYLALDPPNSAQSTIGGLLATNMSGPKRLRYGTARDLVIGLRVILSTGEIARSGGKVVKNVAGYDLNKLYIGSFGTLGVIVEANFKLQPLPESERTLIFTFTNSIDAMRTALDLLQSPLTPSAIELISSKMQSGPHGFTHILPNDGYTLAVNFEGSTISITRQITETLQMASTHHAFMRNDLDGQEQVQFWQTVRNSMQGALTCKICVLPSQISDYMQYIEMICHDHHLDAVTIAHAGNGILYVELNPQEAVSHIVDVITELRTQTHIMKGSFIVERCPFLIKQRLDVWEKPRADFYLMQRLKQQFDPQGLFVRGRFLGGL
jgi:glycolate oxidase FAD binding subunit